MKYFQSVLDSPMHYCDFERHCDVMVEFGKVLGMSLRNAHGFSVAYELQKRVSQYVDAFSTLYGADCVVPKFLYMFHFAIFPKTVFMFHT